ADLLHLHLGNRQKVATVEHDAPALDVHAGRQKPHDRVRGHRLAGPGLPDDAEDLVRARLKPQSPDGVRSIGPVRQPHGQALDAQQRFGGEPNRGFSLGLSTSLRPCPTSDTARTVRRIATPGIADTYHWVRRTPRPWPMRLPHEATLGSERLRKASADSSRIASAMTTLA